MAITRTMYGWSLLGVLSMLCGALSLYYFPKVMPLVSIDITVNKDSARTQAKALSRKYTDVPVEQCYCISVFNHDQNIQNYVELEGGGHQAWQKILSSKTFSPYTWQTRLFRPGSTHEATIFVSPEGIPQSFIEKVPDELFMDEISKQEAQQLAQKSIQEWHHTLSEYKLIEYSSKRQLNNRLDHTFVYQHITQSFHKAHLRLTVTVSGNRTTTVLHFVKIPEAFLRSFNEIRSFNLLLYKIGSSTAFLVYIILFLLTGLVFLSQRRRLLWKKAAAVSLVIAALTLLSRLNGIYLSLFSYNTVIPIKIFIAQQAFALAGSFFLPFCLCTIVFTVAEGWSRSAFAQHIQFWKVLQAPQANSSPIAVQVAIGMLTVPFFVASVTLVYALFINYFGWWLPSSHLSNPNILSLPLPWLTPLSTAFFAGVVEEMVFRVLPLGFVWYFMRNRTYARLWIIIALVVQAVIFGMAHANYPALPSYARVIDASIPALLLGSLYLAFGPLPGIITHVLYDLVLMALPLFASTASGALKNQAIILFFLFLPALYIIFVWLKHKAWHTVTNALNEHWEPPCEDLQHTTTYTRLAPIQPIIRTITLILGFVAGTYWVYQTTWKKDISHTPISRASAIAHAKRYLHTRNSSATSWSSYAHFVSTKNSAGIPFVWQHAPREAFKKLVPSWFTGDYHWLVTFTQPSVNVVERAHQYVIHISPNGTVAKCEETLPESREIKSVEKHDAIDSARDACAEFYSISRETLVLLHVEENCKPKRTDWRITFEDTSRTLNEAKMCYSIVVSGNVVTSIDRSLEIPEQCERDHTLHVQIASYLSFIAYLTCIFFSVIFALLNFSWPIQNRYRSLIALFCLIFFGVQKWNGFHSSLFFYNTQQPWSHQLFTGIAGSVISAALLAALSWVVLLIALQLFTGEGTTKSRLRDLLYGGSFGAMACAVITTYLSLARTHTPHAGYYTALNGTFPLIALASDFLLFAVLHITSMLGITWIMHHWSTSIKAQSAAMFFGAWALTMKVVQPAAESYAALMIAILMLLLFLYGYYARRASYTSAATFGLVVASGTFVPNAAQIYGTSGILMLSVLIIILLAGIVKIGFATTSE